MKTDVVRIWEWLDIHVERQEEIETHDLLYTGCPKKQNTRFRYFDIRKYSIFLFHQIKHCLLKTMIPRSFDLVR